jgi:transposase-like protein
MARDTTVIAIRQPDNINDPLTELAREGARRMLAQVLVAEADAFVAMWKDLKLPDGRDRIVRHGHGPDRTIQTGVGPVEVRRAKVRDRHVGREAKIRFSSSILPKWARRTKSLDAVLPVLYLRGVSTGDFQEALTALLGIDAPNLSPAVISRLTAQWQADYDTWQKRDLSARRYVYVWADGVYLQARMEDNAECWCGRPPQGIDCARLRSCRSQAKEDRPWRRLSESAWIRQSTSTNCMVSTLRRSQCSARSCAGRRWWPSFRNWRRR